MAFCTLAPLKKTYGRLLAKPVVFSDLSSVDVSNALQMKGTKMLKQENSYIFT